LTAIEDFIKRADKAASRSEGAEAFCEASKKGIRIVNRCTLYSDVNIPETTEKIQNIVKQRVQEMLGVEGSHKYKGPCGKRYPIRKSHRKKL